MKKKYQQPLVRVQSVEGEPLLNGGSIVFLYIWLTP